VPRIWGRTSYFRQLRCRISDSKPLTLTLPYSLLLWRKYLKHAPARFRSGQSFMCSSRE
jgi:hypothetical protein